MPEKSRSDPGLILQVLTVLGAHRDCPDHPQVQPMPVSTIPGTITTVTSSSIITVMQPETGQLPGANQQKSVWLSRFPLVRLLQHPP